MQSLTPTTPFGRRSASLGLITGEIARRDALKTATQPGANTPAAVNKWAVFRAITAGREALGLSDRTLTVLNGLLSFHPEVALSLPADADEPANDLVVFPSNKALAARTHGMAEKTLRRHLAALVEAGLIVRRDSPNGKRYARKADQDAGEEGRFAVTFGFDLLPLVLRAAEFDTLAETARLDAIAIKRLSERITLMRRDIGKLLDLADAEGITGPFADYRMLFMGLLTPLRRIGPRRGTLEALAGALDALATDIRTSLEKAIETLEMTGSDGQSDRHQSNSNPDAPDDFEPSPPENRAGEQVQPSAPEQKAATVLPLRLVNEACPDVALYAENGDVKHWSAFRAAVLTIRPMLGISPDAWREAVEVLGEADALIAVATILQRSEHSSEAKSTGQGIAVNGSPAIRSAGGYLRALTLEAGAGRFRLGPVLMALIGQRLKARQTS